MTAWFTAIRDVFVAGVLVGQSHAINFVSGATAVKNPTTGRIDITITGGGGGGGSGDVVGPASSVADRLALFDGVTGKLVKQSTFGIADLIKKNGSVAFTADQSLGGNSLTNVKSVTYGAAPFDNTTSGAAKTITWQAGDCQKIQLTANCTFTFNAPSGVTGLTFELTQDGAGGRTVTWPALVDWPAGIPPTLSTTPGATDIITFYWNGTRYRGFFTSAAASSHSALTNLNVPGDHTWAALVDGTRAFTGGVTVTQAAVSGGTPKALRITGGAHLNSVLSTELIDVDFALARTVQFATGAIATQRAALFREPTYGFVGASVITNAATVAIAGAPVAGTNATITNPWALWVQGGDTKLTGNLMLGPGSLPTVGTLRLAYGATCYGLGVSPGFGNFKLFEWGVGAANNNLGLGDTANTSTIVQSGGAVHAQIGATVRSTVTATTFEVRVAAIQFGAVGVTAPAFKMADETANSATGQPVTFTGQACTGTTSTGGAVILKGTAGTSAEGEVSIQSSGGTKWFRSNATGFAFHNTAPVAKPTVTGSRGGNVALGDALTKLASLGLLTDSTTA